MVFNVNWITYHSFRPIEKPKKTDLVEEGGGSETHPNSRIEKLRFAFRMYDLDEDDMISRVRKIFNILTSGPNKCLWSGL